MTGLKDCDYNPKIAQSFPSNRKQYFFVVSYQTESENLLVSYQTEIYEKMSHHFRKKGRDKPFWEGKKTLFCFFIFRKSPYFYTKKRHYFPEKGCFLLDGIQYFLFPIRRKRLYRMTNNDRLNWCLSLTVRRYFYPQIFPRLFQSSISVLYSMYNEGYDQLVRCQ